MKSCRCQQHQHAERSRACCARLSPGPNFWGGAQFDPAVVHAVRGTERAPAARLIIVVNPSAPSVLPGGGEEGRYPASTLICALAVQRSPTCGPRRFRQPMPRRTHRLNWAVCSSLHVFDLSV
jgi:hypothetical protein